MGRLYLPTVTATLAAFGLSYEVVGGASTRGSEVFSPRGGVAHHTAGPAGGGDMPSLPTLVNGRSDLSGPLCNFGLGRSGHVYVVACGRANHAGLGGWKGLSGNSSVIGIEPENNGSQPWPTAQMDAYYRLAAACSVMGKFSAGYWSMHYEWAPRRKIDPHHIAGAHFRLCTSIHIAAHQLKPAYPPPAPGPGPAPTPTPLTGLESSVLRIVRNPRNPSELWLVDGFSKRYIATPDEAGFYGFQIALDLPTDTREVGKQPQSIPVAAFDALKG
jgi:hypothetical protein